ncbi:MAG: hypothetical protein ACJKTH_00805 [Patescibacteria group bacterium UBA2163]
MEKLKDFVHVGIAGAALGAIGHSKHQTALNVLDETEPVLGELVRTEHDNFILDSEFPIIDDMVDGALIAMLVFGVGKGMYAFLKRVK